MSASVAAENIEIPEESPKVIIDFKYRLIHLAAQRAKQITNGARPRIALKRSNHKATHIAPEEIKARKVGFRIEEGRSPLQVCQRRGRPFSDRLFRIGETKTGGV